MTDKKLITGLWKFADGKVSMDEMMEVVKEWANEENYIELYIRKTSTDQHGIGFAYKYDGTRQGYNEYFDKASDQLKRKFGNGLVGWDIASDTITIKGIGL